MSEKSQDDLHPVLAHWYEDLSRARRKPKPGLWRLPPRHAFAHDYCFLLSDTLGWFIKEAVAADAFSVSISLEHLSSEERSEFVSGELEGAELARWLEEHGFTDAVNDLTEREVIRGVITDAAQFIYEALRCSEKGKLTVAFALLRKPLRESLLLLELLLTDREEFLRLLSTDTSELGIYSLPKSGRALPIIESAVKAVGRQQAFLPSFLYGLRYAKHQHFSLESIWSKATHLVTTDKHFATEPNNLNFIFSDAAAEQSQWDDLYRKLPFLLFYFVDIAAALVSRMVGPDNLEDRGRRAREVGFALTTYFQPPIKPFAVSPLAGFMAPCPLCGNIMLDSIEAIVEIYSDSTASCQSCGVSINLDGDTPPEWILALRVWTLPVLMPIRRAYIAVRNRTSAT